MSDLNELAQLSGKLIDKIEDLYGDNVTLRTSMIMVEIDVNDSDTHLLRYCSDDRAWVQERFLELVLDELANRNRENVEDD
jgi:hypothetical protein